MASLSFSKSDNRTGYRLQFRTTDKRKRSIWLGAMSKKDATKFHSMVEDLVAASKTGSVDPAIQKWVLGIDERFRNLLVQYGLVEPVVVPVSETKDLRLLRDLIDHYIGEQTHFSTITLNCFKQVRHWAIAYFGEKTPVRSITAIKFEAWLRWMVHPTSNDRKALSPSTANKHAKRLRQVLEYATKAKLIMENVTKGVRIGDESNDDRKHYIDRTTAQNIITACPTTEWKLIFALARYCGLRVPTELRSLKWSDIQWDQNRMRIDSKKTGLRFCPIFPEVLPLLQDAFEGAREGAIYVFPTRCDESNLRTHMLRIIEQAGVKPWPKLFVNLRSSCRTDLEDHFRETVINSWIGHSTRVGHKHYSQVRPSDWIEASSFGVGGSTGGSIFSESRAICAPQAILGTQETLEKTALDGCLGKARYPRQGSNLWPQL
jgi:integrase